MVQVIPVPLKHSLGVHQLVDAIPKRTECRVDPLVEYGGQVKHGQRVSSGDEK